MKETALLNTIRLEAIKLGCKLWRNNNGCLQDTRGNYITYGLCPGSGDLIGHTLIGGRAIFTSIEIKRPGKKGEKKQIAWRDAIVKDGGIACVATSIADVQFAVWEYARRQA